ncbi:FAD-dependent monooxygenase [Nocardia sp. NPDC052566]|uniref:FAD-dependent monooxygenase n=1 Tax=Nocardia sp. NPDC052566 TaxID=3364330 RepID=UPI0037C83CEC
MSETRVPVLIAGGGSVGLFAALCLASHGVEALVVEEQPGPSIHPRATGLGPRTLEFLRQLGLVAAVDAVAVDMSDRGLGKIVTETLAALDLSGVPDQTPVRDVWGLDRITPTAIRGTCPQHRLDAVLAPAARERGATLRFGARLVSFEQDAAGVTALLDDGSTVRADYLVAADGVRSATRDALGIGATGPGGLGIPKINILFRADLRPYTGGRQFVTCNITTPAAPGMLVTVDGALEWVFHTDYHPDRGQSPADFTEERCLALIRAAVGDPGLEAQILSQLPWRPRGSVADRFQDGRVFLVGDAAHAVSPIGAFGLNTGVADAHNLAWKLAAVLHGQAGPALLDTYAAERRPVALDTLEQALLRFRNPRLHWDSSPETVAARAAAGGRNAPVVHLGYRYDSAAVIDPQPALPSTEDAELCMDGAAGSRLPHHWIRDRVSTLDLVDTHFTLLTGSAGAAWLRAAKEAAAELDIPLDAFELDEWPARVALGPAGALLVRPDQMIAWRATEPGADPAAELVSVLTRVLARDGRRR